MAKNNIVFIGLGSNEGDRIGYLASAINEISKVKDCTIEAISSLYESLPFGKSDQNNFINAVIKISTSINHLTLLTQLKEIEKKLGRIKRERWGPREIDIDILFFNDLIFSNEIISLPHKGVIYRDFVLVPLCEIQPDLIHPVFNKSICDFIIDLKVKNIINKFSNSLLTEKKIS
jgi:2-amino-4-hydroxy-6-hydroxymethyldihydropteridine diphosphokinase